MNKDGEIYKISDEDMQAVLEGTERGIEVREDQARYDGYKKAFEDMTKKLDEIADKANKDG